jgi:hypothetical protein
LELFRVGGGVYMCDGVCMSMCNKMTMCQCVRSSVKQVVVG